MAKAKKMEEATAVEVIETKEVDFGDLALKVEKPSLNKDKTVTISGNFTELGANIRKLVDRYKNTELTEDNVEYVKTLKKQFVSLRTGVEREIKEWKTVYLDPAEDLLKAMQKELLAIIDEGESALGVQLDAYDQRRKDELTMVLKDYVAEYTEKYELRDEYATQIQLKKQYYNKTAKEEETIADIEAQAKELSRKQREYDAGVQLIKAECEEAGLLPDAYIRELDYKVATEIIVEIKQDKKSKAELEKKAQEEGKVTIGEDADSEVAQQIAKATELPEAQDEERERVLRVHYKASQAKLMSRFFTENNIKFEFIKTDF